MTAFSKVFWGLLLVFLDFRFNGFDILPDIVGFVIVFFGLAALSAHNHHFQTAKTVCIPLIILSLFEIFQAQLQFPAASASMTAWGLLLAIISTCLNLYFIYHLCCGIAVLASESGQLQLQEHARRRWQYYLWFSVAMLFVTLLAMGSPAFILILFVPVFIAGLVVFILILLLVRQADQVFKI